MGRKKSELGLLSYSCYLGDFIHYEKPERIGGLKKIRGGYRKKLNYGRPEFLRLLYLLLRKYCHS
ncbi:hypothetical protein AKJ65_05090 [candidate division MSBL1 archaeon SCGC-AAA259E19]|uniref:Uncharacterized protein n=1 Tax=candidate division MSBL1 archaeon SCGC-AAA259E19 TaxID=1698264 RepID=A0A133UJ29_9EURY|nr:hypothetical protein AKJ65_05090 [candidate division MSBL1 archaeon SCGC-AAA259E19]